MTLPAHRPSIDTCNACGKLFPRKTMRLCAHCALGEEHRFELVREYLRENDGAAIGEIAGATGVSASDVRRFQEGGRLVELDSVCTCGGFGDRCRVCRDKLSTGFRELEQSMQREQAQRPAAGEAPEGRTTYVRRIRRVGEQ